MFSLWREVLNGSGIGGDSVVWYQNVSRKGAHATVWSQSTILEVEFTKSVLSQQTHDNIIISTPRPIACSVDELFIIHRINRMDWLANLLCNGNNDEKCEIYSFLCHPLHHFSSFPREERQRLSFSVSTVVATSYLHLWFIIKPTVESFQSPSRCIDCLICAKNTNNSPKNLLVRPLLLFTWFKRKWNKLRHLTRRTALSPLHNPMIHRKIVTPVQGPYGHWPVWWLVSTNIQQRRLQMFYFLGSIPQTSVGGCCAILVRQFHLNQ